MAHKKPYIFFPIHNKYYQWYLHLVYLAKQRNWNKSIAPCYTESHHIIPKSLGGSDAKDNCIIITAREHFLLHKLLSKMFIVKSKAHIKMLHAFNMMFVTNHLQNRLYNSREHDKIRSAIMMHSVGENHPSYGKEQTIEHRRKNSEANMGNKNHFYGKTHSDENRTMWSEMYTGTKQSEETIQKKIDKMSRYYRIINITDHIDYGIIKNLKQWCKDHQLFDYGGIYDIADGHQIKHKGKHLIVLRCSKRRTPMKGYHVGFGNPTGSSWYYNPMTEECKRFHKHKIIPEGWIKGRIFKKK